MNTDQQPRAVALKAAFAAVLPTTIKAFEVDEVPGSDGGPTGTPPAKYVVFELTRRWVPKGAGDRVTVPGWAVVTHYRATNVPDIRNLRRFVTQALEDRALDLPDGDTFGPFSHEFDGDLVYVAEGWSAFDTWRA